VQTLFGDLSQAQITYLEGQANLVNVGNASNPSGLNITNLLNKRLSDFPASQQPQIQTQINAVNAQLATPQAQQQIALIQQQNNSLQTQTQITSTGPTSADQVNNSTPGGATSTPTTVAENTNISPGVNPNPNPDPIGSSVEPPPEPNPNPGSSRADVVNSLNGINANPDVIDLAAPMTNVLLEYPSYTYGLSLALLSAAEYNNLVAGGQYIPNRVLIASAGRYNNTPGPNQFIRSPYFSEDFYFEDFSMTTVIGTNATTRNTNAIELKFTIIEPYGMTLINRLLDQANDPAVNASNYLDMVYLIQIDFFATDETGTIQGIIPGLTKIIPIKLTQMGITASVSGATYQISAVPYNHAAFDQSAVSTPANFEIASGSVSEFFQSGNGSNKSFADALNGWNTNLANNNKIGVPDTYNFDLHPSIAQSSFTTGGALSPRDTSMVNPNNTTSIRQSNLGQPSKDFNTTSRTMSINAGTSIDKVIDYVVRNSDYIQNQMAIPDGVDPQTYLQQKAQNANQPLNWYKIVPTVTVGQFDPIRNINAKNYTYSVQPYTIYNVKSDVAPQGKATNFVKDYNYIYTGKNDDVITFDLNFNTLYYTAQTAYRSAVSKLYKSPDTATQGNPIQNAGAYQGTGQAPNSVMPMQVKPQVYNAKARATGGSISPKSVAVADLEDSLMTLSAADMLNVQLTIVGDPQFIKQDDCFYSPLLAASNTDGRQGTITASDPRLTPNGSIRTDYTEIYVRLTFRTPVDMDENTGLLKFNSNYQTSIFSGLYKVLQVTSEFKNGQFTQQLNLIRLPFQNKYDYMTQPQSSTGQRNSDPTAQTTATLSKNLPAQNIGSIPSMPTVEDSGQRQAQNLLQPPPIVTQQQQALIDVNSTAPTQPINASNAPVAVIPGQ